MAKLHKGGGWSGAAIVLVAIVATVWLWPRSAPQDQGERTRAELDLRDGVLYLSGADEPFTGTLVEDYGKDSRKLAISVRGGKADGISRGWFENGQLEVEETFDGGVSDGPRTRWYPNGAKKSESTIVRGVVTGRYVTWHDNGQMAAAVTIVDGQPHGLAEAWHPSGTLKSRIQLDRGIPGEKEFFPDVEPIAQAGAQAEPTAP